MFAFQMLLRLFSLITSVYLCIATQLPRYSTDLGITLNQITQTTGPRARFIVYTSVVEYEQDVSQFSDAQLAGLARQAWEEMVAQHESWKNSCTGDKRDFIENHRPFMMSAIALGKEIFFASSMTGNAVNVLLQHDDAFLTQALNACRLNYYPNAEQVDNIMIHRARGSCGEIMASALYLQVHKTLPWYDSTVPARVVALGTDDGTIQNPCSREDLTPGGQPRISCMNWVNWQEMTIVGKRTNIEAVTVQPKKITNLSLRNVWKIKPTTEFSSQ